MSSSLESSISSSLSDSELLKSSELLMSEYTEPLRRGCGLGGGGVTSSERTYNNCDIVLQQNTLYRKQIMGGGGGELLFKGPKQKKKHSLGQKTFTSFTVCYPSLTIFINENFIVTDICMLVLKYL